MPVTPSLIDPVYHPLDPRNATPVTPMEQLAIGGLNPYRSSYWADFKASLGFLPQGISAEEAVLRRENAKQGFLQRNIAGTLAAVRGGAMISSYIGGTAITGGVGGLVTGGFIDTAVGGLWKVSGLSTLQENMRNRAFAEDIGQVVARGTGATLSGHGFKRDEIRELQGFLKDASGRFDVSLEDIQKDVVGYVNAGLFRNVSNVDEFKKQFGQLKKNVSEIVKVLGTTQEEAMQMMSEVTQSGIGQGALACGLQNAQMLSRRTGIAVGNFVSAGVSTAQSFQGTGIGANAGFNMGMGNVGAVQYGLQQGTISANTMFQLGGSTENVAFAAAQQQMSFLNSPLGTMMARAAMNPDGTIDLQKYLQYTQSGQITGEGGVLDIAYRNMRGGGINTWTNNQDAIRTMIASQSSDFLNLTMMSSIRSYAGQMGADPQVVATQMGGFTNDTYQLISGMLMASPGPGGTMSERNLGRMSRRGLLRQYQRGDTAWSEFWRTSAYEWGELGSAISTPFDWVGNQVSNTIDYLTTPKGAIDYLASDRDIAMRAIKRGAKVESLDIPGLNVSGLRIYEDETWGADASEIILADIRKGTIREEDITKYNLEEVYSLPAFKEYVESLEGGKNLYKRGMLSDLRQSHKYRTELVKKHLPGVQGFENAMWLSDREFRYGGERITIVKNEAELIASGNASNEMIKLGQIIGRTDRSKIDALDAIDGVSFSELQEKLYNYQKNNKKDFKAAKTANAKFNKILEVTEFTREMIMNSDDPQAVINTILIAAENANLGVDLKELTITDYGSGLFGKRAYKKGLKKDVDSFVNKVDMALNTADGDLRSDAREYLKEETTQGMLNELFLAYEAGDEGEIGRRMNKIISGAKGKKAKEDLAQLFNMDPAKLFEHFKTRFEIDKETGMSDYERGIFFRLDIAAEQFGTEGELTHEQIKENLERADFTTEEIEAMSPATLNRVGAYAMLPTQMRGRMIGGGPDISTGADAGQTQINKEILLALQQITMELKGERKGIGGGLVEIYNAIKPKK